MKGMEWMWLYSTCQSFLFMVVIACSVRLCLRVRQTQTVTQEGTRVSRPWSVSGCLRLTLGLVGALGGAMELPVTIILNQRHPTCMYTCITLVCGPLLIRHFTMFLVMVLSLDDHLQQVLVHRYPAVVTRRRALCVLLLGWMASILSSFSQFIGSGVLHTWQSGGGSGGVDGHGRVDNSTTSFLTTPASPKYHKELKVIGRFLPYGGFLSKFYAEDMHNFTYAQIHSSHWGVCSADSLLSPHFLVYVHGIAVFILPLICLLGIYLNLLCAKPKENTDTPKKTILNVHLLVLSIFFLVFLCTPIHVIHTLALYSPHTAILPWMNRAAEYVSQVYSVVPQVLFTPAKTQATDAVKDASVDTARGKAVRKVLRGAVQATRWASAKNTLRAKVCPDV